MLEKLLEFLLDNILFVAAGILVVVGAMFSDKFRKYIGQIVTLLILILAVVFVYIVVSEEDRLTVPSGLDTESVDGQEGKRKSIYYSDPEGRLEKRGATSAD